MGDQSRADGTEPDERTDAADAVVPAEPVVPPDAVVPPTPVVHRTPVTSPTPAAASDAAPLQPPSVATPIPAASVPPVPPAAPRQGPSWLSPFTRPVLLGALSHVGIAVGAAFVGAILLMLLVIWSAADLPSTPLGSPSDVRVDAGVILGLVFALTALIFGGELHGSIDAGGTLIPIAGTASIWIFPLTLTVAALVAVFWWGVRQERVHGLPTWQHRAIHSAVVGLVTGLVLLLLTLLFAVRLDAGGVHVLISGAGYRIVLFSLLLVGTAACLGRWAGSASRPGENWFRSGVRLFRMLPRFVRETLTYAAFGAAVFSVLGGVAVVLATWRDVGAGSLALGLLGLLSVAPLAAVIGHLGGITTPTLGFTQSGGTFTVFTGDEPMLWIAVLAAVLLAFFTSLWIGVRRPRTSGVDAASAWQLPLSVLVGWLVVATLFAGVTVSAGTGGASFTSGVGIALWSPLVMAVWALAVEFGAQTLPVLVHAAAPQALGGLVGRRALAGWVSGAGVTDADAAGQPVGDGSVPAPKPLSPAAKRGLVIGASVVGGVALLAVAGAITVSVLNSSRTPEALAKQYVDAIAAGDAEAAGALVDPNVSTGQRAFLTNDVLKAASHRITGVSVKREGPGGGDSAALVVGYRLDGVTQQAYLTASKGEPEFAVLDTWKLDDSLVVPVQIQVTGEGQASVGGVELPLEFEDGYGQATVPMYPGVYELSSDGSKYFELEQKTLTVGSADDAFAELSFAPTEALSDAVAQQVNKLLDGCLASTAADPDGCPFNAYTFHDETQVTWTKQGEPTIEIDGRGTQVSVEGTAIGSYSEDFFGTTRQQQDEDQYSMYGEIQVDGDTVTVAFDDSWW